MIALSFSNRNVMRKINLLCSLLLIGGVAFAQDNRSIEQQDTLQREMVLERDYIPTTDQATKKFFNPLDTQRSTQLKPLSFANTTYGVSMNIRPRLFEPVYQSNAALPKQHTWHARIFGGYPTRLGINMGLLFKTGENGTVDLAIDHQSLKDQVANDILPFKPENKIHDTGLTLRYGHKLPDRLLNVSVSAYNNMQTYFGHSVLSSADSPMPENTPANYPLYQMTGGEISFAISPAPLVLRSPWQYSLFGSVGYGQQGLPIVATEEKKSNAKGLDLMVGGNLAYGITTYNFNFGADLFFKTANVSTVRVSPEESTMPAVLSVTPYLSYRNEQLTLKGGANLQFLNGVAPKFHVSPNITARWKTSDHFSVFATVDGGGEVTGFRELYKLNRYSIPSSISNAMSLARYNATVGLQVGSFNGFSLDLRGGYASYSYFYDWAYDPLTKDPENQDSGLTFTTFAPQRQRDVSHGFITASARYIYPEGLELAGSFQVNTYTMPDKDTNLQGRPSFIMNVSADYQITSSLTAHLNLHGLGGIKYSTMTETPKYTELPFITDLSARISYKVHQNIGLSIIGTNLLNQRKSQWIDYTRQGIGIMGALTIDL